MRRHAWALALLLLLPLLRFPGLLRGEVISADDHLGVHAPFAAAAPVANPHLSDPALQLEPLRAAAVESLRRGQVPLWTADLYGGAPLLGDGQSMAAHPLTLLHLLLPADLAQNLGAASVIVATALGAALLARRLGAAPTGALVAGITLGLGPFTSVWLLHPHAAAFAALPWALLAVEASAPVGLGLAIALLVLAGHPGTLAHGLLLTGGWLLLRRRDPRLLLGILAGLLLAGPALGPLLEGAARSTTAAARGGNTLPAIAFADLLWPGFLGHPARETWQGPGAWADSQLHPGPVALLLALFSLREKTGRALLLAYLACLGAAAIGLPGPVNHARLGEIGVLFVALAAGLVPLPRRAGLPLLLALTASLLYLRDPDQHTIPAAAHDPAPAAWVPPLVAAAADRPILALGWAMQPNLGLRVGLRDLRGYDLPISAETQRLMAALRDRPQAPWYPVEDLPPRGLLRLFGVPLLLTAGAPLPGEALDLPGAPLTATWIEADAPRAWLAFSAVPVSTPQAALDRVKADPSVVDHPPVEGLGAPLTDPSPRQAVDLTEEGDARLLLALEAPNAALLVLPRAWAPGWRARIDGEPAPLLRVGGLVMGLRVEAGPHDIAIYYRPDGWIWGLRAGALGALLLLGLSLDRRLRRPRSRPAHGGAPG